MKIVSFIFVGLFSWLAAAQEVSVSQQTEKPVPELPVNSYEKGLRRIDRNRVYHYQTSRKTEATYSGNLRFGSIRAPKITSADGTTFTQMYGASTNTYFLYDHEWKLFQSLGELGLQFGGGVYTVTGRGRFLSDGTEARERYTFYSFPLSLGLIYRLSFFNSQFLVPYVAGGGTYFVLAENRDDNKSIKAIGTPAVYGAGGVLLNVGSFNRQFAFSLDSEYGVADLWLSFEMRLISASNKDIDMGGTLTSLGIAADY
ncbi:MAG: hypothetical protein N2578_06205 [Bdellovibrionaceae bacterium]|nr:hypothetical protein [Pseudobdellovibrionaceae bacterium]